MKNPNFKNIVWAIDTAEPLEFLRNAEFILGSLVRGTSAKVFPVHIFSKLSKVDSDLYEEAYKALAEKRMAQIAQNSDMPNLNAGKILTVHGTSVRTAANALLDFARENQADALVLSTHSRGIVEKFFLGSFAETLLLRSQIPLITVNPKSKVREKISKILMPSTFEPALRPSFERVLDLCSSLDASLTVFYKEPFVPMLEISYELLQLLEAEALKRKNEGEHYRELAQKRNVRLEICIDPKPGRVSDAIVDYSAGQSIDLIAMASHATDVGPHIGSVCRKVVRSAECPVWTFR